MQGSTCYPPSARGHEPLRSPDTPQQTVLQGSLDPQPPAGPSPRGAASSFPPRRPPAICGQEGVIPKMATWGRQPTGNPRKALDRQESGLLCTHVAWGLSTAWWRWPGTPLPRGNVHTGGTCGRSPGRRVRGEGSRRVQTRSPRVRCWVLRTRSGGGGPPSTPLTQCVPACSPGNTPTPAHPHRHEGTPSPQECPHVAHRTPHGSLHSPQYPLH